MGYVTWISIDRKYNEYKLFGVGTMFLLISIYDFFYFRMHPAQENIFVEGESGNRQDKRVFDRISEAVKLGSNARRDSKQISVFDSYTSKKTRVSFMMAFEDLKIIQLVLATGFRMTATTLAVQGSPLFVKLNFN